MTRIRSPKSPSILNAPPAYQPAFHDQLNNILRLYYHQIDNLNQAVTGEIGTSYLRAIYGVYSSTASQTAAAIDTVYTATFDTTTYTNATSVGSPTSRIICTNPGLYKFDAVLQVSSTSGATGTLYCWPMINGAAIANTGTRKTVRIPNPEEVVACSYVVELVGGEYFELAWAVSDTGIKLNAEAAITSPYTRPVVPSVSLTVSFISASV